ncbi:hypothetical protein CMI37_33950, partial [Candidatus Pacearchaeota archaeon]|nr:hypothetical protein [Candidatus Pacearchaeota archaeon]
DWLGYFADSPDVTMTIGGVQHTGKRFTLIPMAYAADPLWHQTEGDEEREEEREDGGGEEEREETSPFEEEEVEWLREHPDFVGVHDFDEAVRNLSEDEINDYKGQYTQYQENMAAYNEIPDELKQQYGYADWFGMSDEEREQVMNDHVVAQQQAEYDGLSDNLKAKYQTAEEWQNLSPEEKEKAQRRDARTDDVNYILEYKKLTQHMTDAELKREEDFLYDRLDDNAFAKEFATTMKLHGKFREKRRDAEEKAAEDEGRKPERTPAEFEKLKADFRRVYEQVHGPLSEDFFDSYSTDYETLDKEYKKALQVEHDRNAKERQTILGDTANNVGGPDGIDPLPNPPTQDDLLHQVRHIQMWKQHHGPYMTDKKAKDALNQLEIEAYQKANNAGIDLEGLIDKDKEDAKNNGLAYGSSKWFETIGKTHVDEQMKGARYRRQIQRGGELRSNSNYKPWLVIQYDRDGNGTLLDLRSGQEVRREDLRFDKENAGFDYTGSKDKPQLADPESSFWENLDYANLRPIHTDEVGRRTPIEPPEIGHSPKQGRGRAWYHPESKSWINSHRYNDALEELRGAAPGSGMLINIGSGYHGTNQSGDAQRHYGFQTTGVPGSGSEKSYYIDGQGNIVHIDPDASHKLSSPDFSQPQTVNSAIHDWHLSHIQTQATANPGWGTENNQPKTHVIMSPQQQQGPMPLQNAVQEGDALYRRRQQGKQYGKRGFDTLSSDELGMEPTYYGKRGRMTAYQDIPGIRKVPLRTGTEKLKQGFIGTVGYTESGVLTGLAKLLLNTANFSTLGLLGLGWGQEQNNIKRQRANYNRQSKLQQNVKQHMETVTDNGRQRAYLSPGEEDARRQDHKSLQDAYSVKQAEWQNRAREYKNAGDRDGGARAEAESIRFQGLKQGIDKRKVENPADWEHINSLYEQHYGSPQVQATLAPAIGEQASQNIADRFQPLPQQPSQSGETYPMMYDETPSQPRELEPIWS